MGYRVTLRLSERWHAPFGFHRMDSAFAQQTIRSIRERLQRGETVYVMGLAAPGMHNTVVVPLSRDRWSMGTVRLRYRYAEFLVVR